LRYPGATQALKLLPMLIGAPENAEAVHDFVTDEFGIAGADLTMVQLIVGAAIADK
jgi:hypothetical protein